MLWGRCPRAGGWQPGTPRLGSLLKWIEPEPTAVMRHFTVTASAAAPLPSVGAWSESGARSRLARP